MHALRKKKDQDKVSAISFISEVQNSLGKGTYKECNIKYQNKYNKKKPKKLKNSQTQKTKKTKKFKN